MIIYLDTETSGLYPGQICQLSYVMQGEQGVKAKNFFFQVENVEYTAFLVHGLTVERLKTLSNGKRFSDFAQEIYNDILSADLIVAHNVSFDVGFLRKEFERVGKDFPNANLFCTMKQTVSTCKLPRKNGAGYKYPKLIELCTFLGIQEKDILSEMVNLFGTNAGFHDARFDTVAVYLASNVGKNKIQSFSIFNRN